MCIYTYIVIYIYIYRYICIYRCMCIYIYIYIRTEELRPHGEPRAAVLRGSGRLLPLLLHIQLYDTMYFSLSLSIYISLYIYIYIYIYASYIYIYIYMYTHTYTHIHRWAPPPRRGAARAPARRPPWAA